MTGASSARVAATPVSVAAFTGSGVDALGVPAGETEPWRAKANPATSAAPIMVGISTEGGLHDRCQQSSDTVRRELVGRFPGPILADATVRFYMCRTTRVEYTLS